MRGSPAQVLLPTGLFTGTGHQRTAVVRALTGTDEWELEALGSPAELADALLTRCVLRIGTLEPPTTEDLAALALGDREALLLHLRACSYGERLDARAVCPACAAAMDLELETGQLLLEPYADPAPEYPREAGGQPVFLRVPTRADQVAAVQAVDGEAELLRRCVRVPDGGTLSTEAAALVPGLLAELDPQAELELVLSCPECGTGFSSVLDAATYLFQEVADRSGVLINQVHALAMGYHWGEGEILALPHPRRQLYLGLLADAFDAGART